MCGKAQVLIPNAIITFPPGHAVFPSLSAPIRSFAILSQAWSLSLNITPRPTHGLRLDQTRFGSQLCMPTEGMLAWVMAGN